MTREKEREYNTQVICFDIKEKLIDSTVIGKKLQISLQLEEVVRLVNDFENLLEGHQHKNFIFLYHCDV